jgi:threonine dehydrogenase-like Zn-dependent dehydrogenase
VFNAALDNLLFSDLSLRIDRIDKQNGLLQEKMFHTTLLFCRETGDDDVAIQVLYCGICHSDLHTVKNEWRTAMYPVVPG